MSFLAASKSFSEVSFLTCVEFDIDDPNSIIDSLASHNQHKTIVSMLYLLQNFPAPKLADQDLEDFVYMMMKTFQELVGLGRTMAPEDKLSFLIRDLFDFYKVKDVIPVVSESTFSNYVAKLRHYHIANCPAMKKHSEEATRLVAFNEKFEHIEPRLKNLKLSMKPQFTARYEPYSRVLV